MKLARSVLQEIAQGRKATAREVDAMARELLDLREEEDRRNDGTTTVRLEHAGSDAIKGWFAPTRGRLPLSRLHAGARVTMQGRVYSIVSVEGEDPRVVRVR